MLNREIPFLKLTAALAAGILAGVNLPGSRISIWLPLIAFIPLTLSLLYSRKSIISPRHSLLTILFLAAAGFSLYRLKMYYPMPPEPAATIYTVRADNFPEKREKSVKLPVTIISPHPSPRSGKDVRMMLYFRDTISTTDITPGSHFSIFLNPAQITDPDSSDNFNYPLYMKRKGFLLYSFAGAELSPVEGPPGLRNRALLIREKIAALMARYNYRSDALGLTAALTLGHREMLSPDITEDFRRSGITHILAVSGLHVGMFSLLVLGILSFLKGRLSIIPPLAAIIAIWCFALVTGLGPSVTRAALMFSFLHAGLLIRRGVNSINSLLASAFVLLVINPALLFDTGFQLSYSAVLFILLFYRDLVSLIPVKNRLIKKLWSMTAITILAQAGTLPFIIYYFNSVPLLSVITNIVAIPAAFLILAGGIATVVTSPLPVIPHIAAFLANGTSLVLIKVTAMLSAIPFASVSTPAISRPFFLSLVILLPMALSLLLKREKVHIHLVITCAIVSILLSVL
ncbi:MAG: ComEC/Rec2 family competence protein [Bacteroidales bacterium]|nr:ComEC/Rec2 family competence protein [Bacteroidales bacterium]